MMMLGNVKRGVRKVKRWARGGGGPRFRRPVPASVSRFVFYFFGGKKNGQKKFPLHVKKSLLIIMKWLFCLLLFCLLAEKKKKVDTWNVAFGTVSGVGFVGSSWTFGTIFTSPRDLATPTQIELMCWAFSCFTTAFAAGASLQVFFNMVRVFFLLLFF